MASITIKQAYEQGSMRLVFECWRPGVRLGNHHCGQRSQIDIHRALRTWSSERRLDQIKAICSRCGSKEFVRVTNEPEVRQGKRGRR